MNLLHDLFSRLPFEWAQFAFMRHALLAVLMISPLFALITIFPGRSHCSTRRFPFRPNSINP